MIVAKVQISGSRCVPVQLETITKGIVGATVSIEYTDSVWDNLRKTVVFRSYTTKDVVDAGTEVVVPAEVVSRAGQLYMGVYGVDADGAVVIPTTWAALGMVQGAAAPSGDSSTDPSLPVWAQIQAMIGNLDELDTTAKGNLVAAVNEAFVSGGGTVSPAAVQKIVNDYLKANPPASGKDGKDGTDGLTPTIGSNGNWYLGTADTGKPSRGAMGATPDIQIGTVTTLSAGSDATASMGGTAENPLLNLGIPKGADGQGGGSGGETWELITEIEMAEAASLVTINQDKHGNAFSLKRAKMECVIIPDTSDLFTYIKTNINGSAASNNTGVLSPNGNPRYYSFYAELIPGNGAMVWQCCNGSNYNWSSPVEKMGYKYGKLYQAGSMTSFTIIPNDGNKNFGLAGTTIALWGVRT